MTSQPDYKQLQQTWCPITHVKATRQWIWSVKRSFQRKKKDGEKCWHGFNFANSQISYVSREFSCSQM